MREYALNVQVNFYPFFDGGFYLNGSKWRQMGGPMFRVGVGLLDFRVWWMRPYNPSNFPPDTPIV